MNLLELYSPEICEHSTQHRDVDACRELWRTVIEHAVLDLHYLQRFTRRTNLQKHEIEKLRRIEECPPVAFIEGSWFEEICDYLALDAGDLRRGLEEYVESAA